MAGPNRRTSVVVARVLAKPKLGEGWSSCKSQPKVDRGAHAPRVMVIAPSRVRTFSGIGIRTTVSAKAPKPAREGACAPPKKLKICLALPVGIVTRGVILRALGEYMRKFKRFPPPTLRFRSLLILAGAFALLAAFAPCANSALLRFYDFEGPAIIVNQGSHQPALEQGDLPPFAVLFQNDDGTPYTNTNLSAENGAILGTTNLPPGALPNTTSLGLHSSGSAHLNLVMTFPSATGIYDIQSVSFASRGSGNGFQSVQLQMSTNGTNWTNLSVVTTIPSTIVTITLNNTLNPGGTIGVTNLQVRLNFTGGQSNGGNLQNLIDNIQVNGTVVPEPATVAGGLLGVLALCWYQRRRLKSLRALPAHVTLVL